MPQQRWSTRLQELAAAQAAAEEQAEHTASSRWAAHAGRTGRSGSTGRTGRSGQSPEPIQWRAQPPLWQRVKRGVAVPVTAAAVVFLAALLFSIASVWLQPHGAGASNDTHSNGSLTGSVDAQLRDSNTTANDGSGDELGSELALNDAANAAGTIIVHVIGEVNRPGVYELPPGSRALAAIDAAGGATDAAVLAALNLARPLGDGEQLFVPNPEQLSAAGGIGGANFAGASTGEFASGGMTATPPGGQLVNLNTADLTTLETLPHIGPSLAARIVDWRAGNGGFRSIDQLLEVSGIGPKTFDDLRAHVTV